MHIVLSTHTYESSVIPSKNHALHLTPPIICIRPNTPFDAPSHTLHHAYQVTVVDAVHLASRTRSTFGVEELGLVLGCAIAEGRAVVEAHEWSAGCCEDNPGVLAFFVLEIRDCAHFEGG